MERNREILKKRLQEVFELLEEYAPSWYTQQEHERLKAALALKGKSQ